MIENANKAYDIEELAISIHKSKREKFCYEIIWQSLREVHFNSMKLNGAMILKVIMRKNKIIFMTLNNWQDMRSFSELSSFLKKILNCQ